jgi:hypothetical protein
VIDFASLVEISAGVVANIYTFRSRFDDSTGDMSKRAIICAHNQKWLGFLAFVSFV